MARLTGAATLFVNGEGFVGDPERRGFLGVPAPLRAGTNRIFVAGVEGGFELEFWKPRTRIVLGTWDLRHPLIDGDPKSMNFMTDLEMPVFNASSTPIQALHFHYGCAQSDTGRNVPLLTDWADGGKIGPLGLMLKSSPLFGFRENDAGPGTTDFLVPLCSYAEGDGTADRRVIELHLGDEHGRAPTAPKWRRIPRDGDWFLVYGTHGSEEDRSTSLSLARYCQQRLWYRANVCPLLVSDEMMLHPEDSGLIIHDDMVAVAFGDTSVNAVLTEPQETKEVADGPSLEIRSPTLGKRTRTICPLGSFSAPDARTMRLLYAFDPFFDLEKADTRATFRVDPVTKSKLVRQN